MEWMAGGELGWVVKRDDMVWPGTYSMSGADLKAIWGDHCGIVCTSSNAKAVLGWSFERREKVLLFPDQHLGRWTGYKMGIPLEQMVVWDFTKPMGGLTAQHISDAKGIRWKGHCAVHQMFQPQHVDNFKKQHPDGIVISHPENALDVSLRSDYVGSTQFSLNTVRHRAKAGGPWRGGRGQSRWARRAGAPRRRAPGGTWPPDRSAAWSGGEA